MEKHSRSPSIYLDSYTILHMWGNNTCFDAYFLMTEKWQLLKFRSRHKCIMWAKVVSKLTYVFFFSLIFRGFPFDVFATCVYAFLWNICAWCDALALKKYFTFKKVGENHEITFHKKIYAYITANKQNKNKLATFKTNFCSHLKCEFHS